MLRLTAIKREMNKVKKERETERHEEKRDAGEQRVEGIIYKLGNGNGEVISKRRKQRVQWGAVWMGMGESENETSERESDEREKRRRARDERKKKE